ncbi:hypothetical protein TNCV_369741 [Trichonephila clavipes]|nr:hypothetical protein TNCV_369741 [Trichonephila clavipes]
MYKRHSQHGLSLPIPSVFRLGTQFTMIGFLLIGVLLTFSPVSSDVPLKFTTMMHDEKQELKIPKLQDENIGNVQQLFPSEDEFDIDALQQKYLEYLNEKEELIFPSESTFSRTRKEEKKECHITVQKVYAGIIGRR